jgi:DNA-binding GntR family transcriptional regulator
MPAVPHAGAGLAHGYRVLHRRFHGIIHDMAQSAVVVRISRRMWDMSDLLINTSGVPQPLASAVQATGFTDAERDRIEAQMGKAIADLELEANALFEY